MQITLKNVRLSFADIFTAKAIADGKPRFSCNFLLDPTVAADKKQIKAVQAGIDKLIREELKLKKLPADKICLHDGDEKSYDGYEGMIYVSAANPKRPQIVNRARGPVAEDDGIEVPYAGCIVNGVITLWAQDNDYGKRINASLEIVQFVKDGDSFGAPKVQADACLPDLGDPDEDDGEDEDDDLG
tara:strand:+ start:7394 stop:7951 length:558 start_codon:yes stop_codon:yes gene_type:complete